ncbi:serine/threonine protein kinase [Tessaracoccus sp. OS52]|uniref:serine/threonine-protein kinase n=1 Tax=Tessaracoccus sp. OS52 TaxID=2886691 RepID=UPI001D0FDE13|nr:serine/threonine-protein kinase [Tessaracoccus sp. OS52]MCC2592368.1 serine/threonine protein kinase [Tessaracoccus sp. OS52]
MEMIGRYRITGRIGSGSFATVYRGQDDVLEVPVAVKVLADNWAGNDDVRARFLAEARLLRRLADERVVRVYDIGTNERNQPYFVMDLADGGSLDTLRKRLVAPGLALRLCAEACRALDVLHRNQLVHRDVTPGNILLSNGPGGVRVMLADLGVAKSLLDEYRDTMTAGTPAYMAPEQARSTQLDHRSDLYSMACVTYAMLTGRPPFPARNLQEVLDRNPHIGPPPIAAQIGAPLLLDEVLASALAVDPNRRPQTAIQLADALDRLADATPGGDQFAPRRVGGGSVQTPTSAGSVPSAPAPPVVATSGGHQSSSLRPHPQTPMVMLDNYIGKDRYRPKKSTETHSPWFYVWISFSALALLGLTMWATVYFLTG